MNTLCVAIFSTGIVFVLLSVVGINKEKAKNSLNVGIETVFDKVSYLFKRILNKSKKASIENELYQSASLLENMIKLQKNSPKGAAYIIEQISSYSKELKKPFEYMLYYLSLNQKKEAVSAFEKECGTKTAKEYGDILIKMDSTNPADLKESISLFRRRLREESITREKNKNEIISDLIYIPVLANVMLIFINFIYISYYAEQREIFQQLLF
ncbi:MAG: hypothetical protein E7228_03960 [Clostridiales bacterium]|nr:hypothetical protein [Clostridiales bacterium]